MVTTGGNRAPHASKDLSERAQRLLATLVREYIEHGEPVSSHWLATHAGWAVSSATVRNILARLEEHGLLRQPHTSAGRVPTDLGYRCYVDGILVSRRAARPAPEVEARLRLAASMQDVLARVSQELWRVSHHVGFALAPAEESTLARVEFVPLDSARILVVVVSLGGSVSHKVIAFDEPVSRDDLIQAGNYLTQEFAGMTIAEARSAVIERLTAERVLYDQLLARALRLASTSFEAVPSDDLVYVSGMPSIVDDGLHADLSTLRTLLAMIEEKHRLIRLLTAFMDEPGGLTVVIGTEHENPEMQSLSLVAATYTDGQRTGAVGILGPTRMRYPRAIAAVDGLSQAVSRVLGDTQS